MSEISLAQQLAHETDDYIVYQACAQLCLTVEETEAVVNEWQAIRGRVERRRVDEKEPRA